MHADPAPLRRRDFLRAVAAGPAGGIATAHNRSAEGPARREVDVAIVGAGLAGLTAARELRRAGLTVCVVEARDRVGGRTWDRPIGGGHVVEGGGQWVGPGQTHILALARELGVRTFPSYTKGKLVASVGQLRLTQKPERKGSRDLRRIRGLLEGIAKDVPLDAPWKAARAAAWDAVTVADWLRREHARTATREELELDIETEVGPPSRLSLLWYLFYVHSAGGLHALNTDAQQLRFRGGPQSLSTKLAAALGTDLVLSSPVRRITYGKGQRAEVESERVHISARRVVVAMMPADTRRIAFVPEAPAPRRGLVKGWRGEPAVKINVVNRTPFWRAAGLSGLGMNDGGPVGLTFDNSPPDGSRGVLVVFANAERLPADARIRRTAVLGDLARLFGAEARKAVAYFETDWGAERWTAGCVSPLPCGVLSRYGRVAGARRAGPLGRH
jgi:monoamine oxidase